MRCIFPWALVTVVCFASAQAGEGLYPLAKGWSWTYVDDQGNPSIREVSTTATVFGHEVQVITYSDSQTRNYYSTSLTGDVLWHGFWHPAGQAYYDPPLVLLTADAAPGDSWETLSQAYCDPEGTQPAGFEVLYAVEALALETIDVPAGEFTALKTTGGSVRGCPGGSRSALGAAWAFGVADASATKGMEVHYWYVRNLGLAYSEITGSFERMLSLKSWAEPEVASESISWGELKARYR